MKYFNKIISLANKFENKLNKLAQKVSVQPVDLQIVLKSANFFTDEVVKNVGLMLDKLKIPINTKVIVDIIADAGPKIDYKVTGDIEAKQADALRKMLLQKYGQAMINVLKQDDNTKAISSSVTCGWLSF